MSEYISIDLSDGIITPPYNKTVGLCGESFVKGVTFTLPSKYVGWSVFVDIKNPASTSYRQQVLGVSNGVFSYDFSANDLCKRGRLFLDVVVINTDSDNVQHIAKPFSGEFAVKQAVCATGEPGSITTILTDSLRETIENLRSMTVSVANNALVINTEVEYDA